jgi:glycosyltransferase involved in cell wall biosynthesis
LNVLRRKGFGKPAVCIQVGTNPAVFRKMDASDLREKMGLRAAFVIGFVGQIGYWKGLDTLIKALALLPKDCALVLVGTGPDEAKLRLLADELGVSRRVRWVPWADHREIVEYMCALDVFVLPSRTLKRWREDFGRVLIEAMACETPVVGSDSGEIPNVIGDAGLVFHENDEQELAGHLRRLMDDPSLRKTLGRCGRERVLERFTYEKVAAQTVDFYRHICLSA